MKIYDERTRARISDRKSASQRAQETLRGEEGRVNVMLTEVATDLLDEKARELGLTRSELIERIARLALPNDRGTSFGGVADQFAADCLERLAENKAQIEAHQSAIASLEKSNKLLIEQLSRIEELKQKLNQPED